MVKEVWKKIVDSEFYEVSNLGSVRSLRNNKNKKLKGSLTKKGYLTVHLTVGDKQKKYNIHQLVAESFLSHKRCGMSLVVHHVDSNKLNNNVSNLEIVTNRYNTSYIRPNNTSKFTGVSWCKFTNKWRAVININGKYTHLGRFKTELDAHNVYQKALKDESKK